MILQKYELRLVASHPVEMEMVPPIFIHLFIIYILYTFLFL